MRQVYNNVKDYASTLLYFLKVMGDKCRGNKMFHDSVLVYHYFSFLLHVSDFQEKQSELWKFFEIS